MKKFRVTLQRLYDYDFDGSDIKDFIVEGESVEQVDETYTIPGEQIVKRIEPIQNGE